MRFHLVPFMILGFSVVNSAWSSEDPVAACARVFAPGALAEAGAPTAHDAPDARDLEVLHAVARLYPEMLRLTGKVHGTPEGSKAVAQAESPSIRLFGEKHPEFDRTAIGVLAMRWVLAGDYERFTRSHAPGARLSRESFEQIRRSTQSVLKSPEDIDAMVVYMVINDLGKIDAVVQQVEKMTGKAEVDHDKILLTALQDHPEISPSFARLSARHREWIIKGLAAQFNIGQFIQAESVPASLEGLRGLDPEAMDFYLLHAAFDIDGAAGHVNPAGALVMNEPTYQAFRMATDALKGLERGESVTQVYDAYLGRRARGLWLSLDTPYERAALRICLMLRASRPRDTMGVLRALDLLPPNASAILEKELNVNGVGDGWATLPYYAPALLANARAGSNDPNEGLRIGLLSLARVYQEARVELRGRAGDGVFTAFLGKLAHAAKTPEALSQNVIQLHLVGKDAEAALESRVSIDANRFGRLHSLAELPGTRLALIGIGGGSDGVQAAQLGLLLGLASGKHVPCAISVRTSKPASLGAGNQVAEDRTVQDHGGVVVPGVYRIKPESRGSGRFLENLPADELPMYLVLDEQNGTLPARLDAAIRDAGGADSIVGVDTGGDALYGAVAIEGAKATPDQDLRVLEALGQMRGYANIVTAEIATGVDSPPNAQEVLAAARALYYEPSPREAELILGRYLKWKMDGSDEARFGKTALAWQLALRGALGNQTLPLPQRVVLDSRNPWNPFLWMSASMKGIFFMRLEDHLAAISRGR